jgi:hypothetical protein
MFIGRTKNRGQALRRERSRDCDKSLAERDDGSAMHHRSDSELSEFVFRNAGNTM